MNNVEWHLCLLVYTNYKQAGPSSLPLCSLTVKNENNIFSVSATERETLKEEVMKVGIPLANYHDELEHVETDEEEPASKRSSSVFDVIMQQEPPATRSREARFDAEFDAYLSIRKLPDDADLAL